MIEIHTPLYSKAYMHTNKPNSWGRITSDNEQHSMFFKYFNKMGDIVVSSYGMDYIIPKEYVREDMLVFAKISKQEMVNIKEEQNDFLDMDSKKR